MKCIIIDDEPLARQGLKSLVEMIPDLELLSSFSNIQDADTFLLNNEVDLIFIDIQLPLITGLDYIKMSRLKPLVIIVTAFPEYAVDGFDLDVVDYLTKPVRFERFYKAYQKARQKYEINQDTETKLNADKDIIYIRSNRKFIRIETNNICYIEALKDYVNVNYENQNIPVSLNLKAIESKLNKEIFIRVNKSYIINVNFIKSIENEQLVLKNKEITIGDHYRKNLDDYLKRINIIKREY